VYRQPAVTGTAVLAPALSGGPGSAPTTPARPWSPTPGPAEPRPGDTSEQEPEQRAGGVDLFDRRRGGLHAVQQRGQILGPGQLDADQRRPGLPVAALDVLEQRDVVVRAQHLVQEPPQRPRLLWEVDQEVVLAALVDQGPLHHLGVPADIVVAARDPGQHARAGPDGRGPGHALTGQVVQQPGGQRPRGFGDDPVDLVQGQHLPADPALVDGEDPGPGGRDQRGGALPGPADRGAVHERVHLGQRDRPARGQRGGHAGGAGRLGPDDPDFG